MAAFFICLLYLMVWSQSCKRLIAFILINCFCMILAHFMGPFCFSCTDVRKG